MASGGGGAAFSANFVSNPTLPQGATFSRGTVATQYNSSGLLQYAPSNLLLQSQALNLSPWITQPNVTLTSTNTGVAPDGTLTASLWTFSGTS